MNVLYNPLRSDDLEYRIEGEAIFFKYFDKVIKVDFAALPNGRMVESLDFIPLAEKINGELVVEIRQPVDNQGKVLDMDNNFDISEYEEIVVIWISNITEFET